jgi:hypothetical protein
MSSKQNEFKPYILPENTSVKEFTVRAIILGALFGILFGAATVYLALKAGLTVSASIPIAVLAISLGRRFLGTTILENNIIQTAGQRHLEQTPDRRIGHHLWLLFCYGFEPYRGHHRVVQQSHFGHDHCYYHGYRTGIYRCGLDGQGV